MELCSEINLPVAIEKTEWATTLIVFLGILLNGRTLTLSVPIEKQQKALKLLKDLTGKKRATIKQMQVLTGYLNFLKKAIVPGRTFTRRMYVKYANLSGSAKHGNKLKQHHHVSLDAEFRFDCEVWHFFLSNYRDLVICRPMMDLSTWTTARQLKLSSDASAAKNLGVGAVFNNDWIAEQWEPGFIEKFNPSIEYLELFGLTAAILT